MDKNLVSPLVSVLIATYNRGNFITEAIESVLAQSLTDWELIIVDDGSTDNTEAVVASYLTDPRCRYIKNEQNKNISFTRNRGLAEARGKYIAILDSDDRWHDKDKLKKQISFLENHPDYALVGSRVIAISATGQELTRYDYPLDDKTLRKTILAKNPFTHSSVVYRREILAIIGTYDLKLNGIEDYDLWLRIGTRFKFANLPDYTLEYRIHGTNISLTGRQKLMRINLNLLAKYHLFYPHFYRAWLRRHFRYWAFTVLSLFLK